MNEVMLSGKVLTVDDITGAKQKQASPFNIQDEIVMILSDAHAIQAWVKVTMDTIKVDVWGASREGGHTFMEWAMKKREQGLFRDGVNWTLFAGPLFDRNGYKFSYHFDVHVDAPREV